MVQADGVVEIGRCVLAVGSSTDGSGEFAVQLPHVVSLAGWHFGSQDQFLGGDEVWQVIAAAGAADVYLLQLALILAGSWRLVGKVFRVLLEGTPAHLDMRRRLQQIAYKDFGIAYITIQIEQSLEGCTERHHFDHLLAPETRREFEYPGQGQA